MKEQARKWWQIYEVNYGLIDLLTFNLPLLRILKLIHSGYFQRLLSFLPSNIIFEKVHVFWVLIFYAIKYYPMDSKACIELCVIPDNRVMNYILPELFSSLFPFVPSQVSWGNKLIKIFSNYRPFLLPWYIIISEIYSPPPSFFLNFLTFL